MEQEAQRGGTGTQYLLGMHPGIKKEETGKHRKKSMRTNPDT